MTSSLGVGAASSELEGCDDSPELSYGAHPRAAPEASPAPAGGEELSFVQMPM